MNQIFEFMVANPPAHVISKASEIVRSNIPPGSHLNIFKAKPDSQGMLLSCKSDFGIIHNCSISIRAARCENKIGTTVIIEVCSCEKMQSLYHRLKNEL